MKTQRMRRLAALPAIAALSIGVLAGCGGDDSDDSKDSDDSSQSDDADDNSDDSSDDDSDAAADDSSDDDSDDAGDDDAGDDAPATNADLGDFPSEIPVVDGEVTSSYSVEGDSHLAVIAVDDDGEEAYDDASELLTDAGFDESEAAEVSGTYVGIFTNDDWQVTVSTSDSVTGSGTDVTYTVTRP